MRKKIGLVVILLCCSLGGFTQNIQYFKVDTLRHSVLLTSSKGMKHPGALKAPYDIPISLKQDRKAVMDIITLLKEKFLEVSDEDFTALKMVVCKVFISKKGQVIYYEIRIPSESVHILPQYKKQFQEVMETLSAWDFSRYGLNIPFKDKQVNQYGVIGFPLLWIRSNPAE